MSESNPSAESEQPIVARYGAYYRNMRYVLTAILLIMAAWFAYDGLVAWPASNARFAKLEADIKAADLAKQDSITLREQQREVKIHSDFDILCQKGLAIALPLAGIALTMWARHNSRGEIRLAGDRLSAPGHPEITFDDITALDQRLWDRKDIAFVQYEKGGQSGRIRLDAFVYQADPIVKIYQRVEAFMKEETDAPSTEEESPSER